MDLSPAQRVLAFVTIFVVLAGTGVYLLISATHGHPAASSRPSASHSAPPAASSPAAATPALPAASPSAPDIYAWLPFSQADLAQAAAVTESFGAAYGTYSYTESAASYASSMRNLATSELDATLERGYATPGVASQRTQQKSVYTGTAVINSLRTFGPSSLTFVVTINQSLTTKSGKSQVSAQYAVTVVNSGGAWLVNDIESAAAGNF